MPPRPGACPACCWCSPARTFGRMASAIYPARRRWSAATASRGTTRRVLCLRSARSGTWVEPVALVVAETLAAARDAAEAIEVDYEALPSVTEAKDAMAPGAAQLFDHIPGNLVFDWDNDTSDAKATDAAFAKAAHTVSLELVNNRVVVNSMEPRNAIGDYDPASGRSTLYTATQGPHFVRDPLAEIVLKIPEGQAPPDHAQRRRRVRHEGLRLSRAGAGGLGQPQAGTAGEVAGGPLRGLRLRQSGPRSRHARRACA